MKWKLKNPFKFTNKNKNPKANIRRKYLYTLTDPNSPEIIIDEEHHLGMEQNYDEISWFV